MNENEETGVEVNEAHIWSSEHGRAWWDDFRKHFSSAGRIEVLVASLGGDRVWVRCADRDHALWLTETMVANGCPAASVKVKRRAAEGVSS